MKALREKESSKTFDGMMKALSEEVASVANRFIAKVKELDSSSSDIYHFSMKNTYQMKTLVALFNKFV